jgi:hypothetical protein
MRFLKAILSLLLLTYSACAANHSLPPAVPALRMDSNLTLPGYAVKREIAVRRVLILVHGLNGNGKSTWTSANDTYWPALMKSDPAFEDFDIYVYEYQTSMFGNCLAITDVANNMRTYLKNDRVFEDHDQVVFLAHSMGGLIVRQFLLRNRDTIDKVPLTMFFATPTAGSSKADTLHLLPTCSQVEDLRTLDANSYLKSQQSDWYSSGFQERMKSYCAFETQNIGGSLVVNQSSAILLCTKDPEALPTNHSDAVKPSSTTDLSHIIVRNAIKDLPSPNLPQLDPLEQNRELKKQVGDLKDRLDQRFRNRGKREELGRFIREGDILLQATLKGPPAPLPEKEANEWFTRARHYLLDNFDSSYEARFVAADPGLPISYGLPKEYEGLIKGILNRLTVLRGFIEDLRD